MSSSFKGFSNFCYNLHFDHFVDRLVIKSLFRTSRVQDKKYNAMHCNTLQCNAQRISVCRLQFLDLILSLPFCFDFSLIRSPQCFPYPVSFSFFNVLCPP